MSHVATAEIDRQLITDAVNRCLEARSSCRVNVLWGTGSTSFAVISVRTVHCMHHIIYGACSIICYLH